MSEPKIRPVTRDEWYELASGFRDCGFRHAWDFNVECAAQQSTALEHVAIVDGESTLGLASVRIKRIPIVGAGIAYVGGGPLTRRRDEEDLRSLEVCLHALKRGYVDDRKLQLRISPPLTTPASRDDVDAVYRACGFAPAAEAARYRTMVLDLSPPLSEIRAGLSKRWRRQLKKGERTPFEVEIGTGTDLFGRFCELFETFVVWKDFEVEHGPRFHQRVHAALPEAFRYLVLLSRHEGKLAYGLVLAVTGDTAVYVLGASNPELRDLRPGHYLHWRAIEELQRRGIRWYDLGGIDPEANPGVYEFKAGMTEVDIESPGPFECAPNAARGLLVNAAERGYRQWRNFRRHGLQLGRD